MNTETINGPRQLWWRCGIVLVALLVVALVKWRVLESTVAYSTADGALINLTGCQRMFSQQLGKAAIGLQLAAREHNQADWNRWHAQLEEVLQSFEGGHNAVRDRRSEAGLAGEHSQSIQEKLADIESVYSSITVVGHELLNATYENFGPNKPKDWDVRFGQFQIDTNTYLDKINDVVFELAEDSRANVLLACNLTRWGLVFTFMLIGLLATGVLAPAIERLRNENATLMQAKHSVEQQHGLAIELNDLLSAAMARVDTIFNTAADAIVIVDDQGRIERVNQAAESIFQCHASQLRRKEIGCIVELELQALAEKAEQAKAAGLTSQLLLSGHRTLGLHPEAPAFPVELSASWTKISGKDYYTAIIRDVSQRVAMESQLLVARKMEALGILSAGVAHEINTPMQFVSDNMEYVSDSVGRLCEIIEQCESYLTIDKPIPWEERRLEVDALLARCNYEYVRSQVDEAVGDCREGIARTLSILHAMKTFSHPGEDERVWVDLNESVRSTLTISRNRWKYSSSVQLHLDEDLPSIPVFASELNQVLLNLVVNASDAVSDRHGDGDQGVITITTSFTDAEVEIEVADNGVGIPEENQHKVFDQFFTTKDVGKGTGQGLAICHNVVVQRHGGRLAFDSQEGVGTTFRIALPREPQEEAESAESHDLISLS